MTDLFKFLVESNAIEGITKAPTGWDIQVAKAFLSRPEITVGGLTYLVSVIQPGAILRDKLGQNVKVGNYFPPSGGPPIVRQLERLLWEIYKNVIPPYTAHQCYESLHPFTDGNGRSGRLLWLWQMNKFHNGAPLRFLHTYYYQTLSAWQGK